MPNPMPPEFLELAKAIMDMRDAGANLDATKRRVESLTMSLVPAAQRINGDVEYQTVGPALSALEKVGSYATALECHSHYDKLRRILDLAKPGGTVGGPAVGGPGGTVQRGPGGGR